MTGDVLVCLDGDDTGAVLAAEAAEGDGFWLGLAAAAWREKKESMRPCPGVAAAAFLGVFRFGVVRGATMITIDQASRRERCQTRAKTNG